MHIKDEKIIGQLLDALSFEAPGSERLIVVMLMLAWCKLSAAADCPASLTMSQCQGQTPPQLVKRLRLLGERLGLEVFENESRHLGGLKASTLEQVMALCLQMQHSGALDGFDPSYAAILDYRGGPFVSEDVSELLLRLAGDVSDKRIYLPWEGSGQLLGRLIQARADVTLETGDDPTLAQLIQVILGGTARIVRNDPIRNPACVHAGQLQRFDLTLCFPPMLGKLDRSITTNDRYGRFKEKTGSMTVLAIRHVLAQTRGRIVFVCSHAMLTRSGSERLLREDLLKNHLLEAVIALPAGLMFISATPLAVLLLNTAKASQCVRFVNADDAMFKQMPAGGKVRLSQLDHLAQLALSGCDGPLVRNLPVSVILKQDSQLQPGRYIDNETETQVRGHLQQRAMVRLSDLAQLLKPLRRVTADGVRVYEPVLSDFPEYGYIRQASNAQLLAPDAAQISQGFLQPGDIVLMQKGQVGKVGIIGQNAPPAGAGGWVVASSCVLIRLPPAPMLEPIALLMLLRSDLGRHLLRKPRQGRAALAVSGKELEQLMLPLPDASEKQQALAAFMQQQALQQQILGLQRRQDDLDPGYWRLQAPGASTT